jgi:hypothetical protein
MSTPTKSVKKDDKRRLTRTTGDIERETGVTFGVPGNTSLKKYFTDSGVPGLAKILEKIEASND